MFVVVFFIIFMISLDAVKKKRIVDERIIKNNIRPIESALKIENKITLTEWFWKSV